MLKLMLCMSRFVEISWFLRNIIVSSFNFLSTLSAIVLIP